MHAISPTLDPKESTFLRPYKEIIKRNPKTVGFLKVLQGTQKEQPFSAHAAALAAAGGLDDGVLHQDGAFAVNSVQVPIPVYSSS